MIIALQKIYYFLYEGGSMSVSTYYNIAVRPQASDRATMIALMRAVCVPCAPSGQYRNDMTVWYCGTPLSMFSVSQMKGDVREGQSAEVLAAAGKDPGKYTDCFMISEDLPYNSVLGNMCRDIAASFGGGAVSITDEFGDGTEKCVYVQGADAGSPADMQKMNEITETAFGHMLEPGRSNGGGFGKFRPGDGYRTAHAVYAFIAGSIPDTRCRLAGLRASLNMLTFAEYCLGAEGASPEELTGHPEKFLNGYRTALAESGCRPDLMMGGLANLKKLKIG